MFIQEFYDFLSFLEGQNVATRRPPEQVDKAMYFVAIDTFDKWLDHYAKTKKISTFLEPFKRRKDIPMTSGVGDLPGDYAIYRELYKMTPLSAGESAASQKIDVVDDNFWNYRRNRKVGPASLARPIARIEYNKAEVPVKKLEVYPSTVTQIELLYFKTPAHPKYNYIQSGSRYAFQEAGSVDIEFSVLLYPDMLYRVLSLVGVNLRENQMVQFMELYKSQEQRK
jgi:hypothetical protein